MTIKVTDEMIEQQFPDELTPMGVYVCSGYYWSGYFAYCLENDLFFEGDSEYVGTEHGEGCDEHGTN